MDKLEIFTRLKNIREDIYRKKNIPTDWIVANAIDNLMNDIRSDYYGVGTPVAFTVDESL